MVSREHKKAAALHEKLQLLRSITNSHAVNKTSILVDASKYIEELKLKVERLNQDIVHAQSSSDNSSWPMVAVETLEKGFQVNVYSEKSCPGLLVSILEVFDGLGLTVLEARVSCTDNFRLEALGEEYKAANKLASFLCGIDLYNHGINYFPVGALRLSVPGTFLIYSEKGEDNGEGINAQVVKQAVSQAIKNWTENNEQD